VVYVYPFRCRLCGRRFLAVQWGTRYGGSADDRRELERIPVRLPAAVSTARGRAQGTTVDLSTEGCAIHVAGSFTAGDVVQVEIRLAPDSGHVATATAVVRSVGPEMVGVYFQFMPAEDRQRLRRFMRDLLPAAESEIEAWDAAPRRTTALTFWITALLLLTVVLALIALMPGVSLCTWGVDC
jgi:hypothetical protein